MPKASVLPEPVLALPQMSRPARASRMVRAWIANGSTMPAARQGRGEVGGDAERLESCCGHESAFVVGEDITEGGDAGSRLLGGPIPARRAFVRAERFRG